MARAMSAVVYRVSVARPERKDSRVLWTTDSLSNILERHKGNIISVHEYELKEKIYDAAG